MEEMMKEADSKANRSPFAKKLKRQRRSVTIRLDGSTVEYFKAMADETGVRYQTLINLYLRECAATGKRLSLSWSAKGAA
jgi:predicted DNA binding CopG/RHH family protein